MRLGLQSGVLALAMIAAGIALYFRQPVFVLDEAELLSDDERAFIADYHGLMTADYGIDYRVVTTNEDTSILEQSVDLFATLGVGSRGELARGLLLVINPLRDEVRLEVGYALESVYPDAFIAYVEQRQMVPFFADDRVADGILATTELIIDRARRQTAGGGLDPAEIWMAGSGGAGAQTRAGIGTGYEVNTGGSAESGIESFRPDSPETALAAYFAAMDRGDGNPSLPFYSTETRAMLDGRTVTPAQMDMVVRTYRDCAPQATRTDSQGTRAVIRYPAGQRDCAPWFFTRQDGGWRLDLATLGAAIRFGRSNAWRRSEAGFGPYRFAFEDWRFDGNGFPVD